MQGQVQGLIWSFQLVVVTGFLEVVLTVFLEVLAKSLVVIFYVKVLALVLLSEQASEG